MEKSIYIILSQTGTLFSRLLKFFTRAEYNHSSIALTPDLNKMYSFGRLNPYNPFVGGFVEEGKDTGTFKRFFKTKALVFELKVDEKKYLALKSFLEYFSAHKIEFHYNYLGILFACFKKNHESKNRFYCSQFVRTCLSVFDIDNAGTLPKVIKPIDFLKLENKKLIFCGYLRQYKK